MTDSSSRAGRAGPMAHRRAPGTFTRAPSRTCRTRALSLAKSSAAGLEMAIQNAIFPAIQTQVCVAAQMTSVRKHV